MRQHEAKLKTPQLREVYFCYYCAIVSACVSSNGGVLAGNKLMSGSAGGARCYVQPPLNTFHMQFNYLLKLYNFQNQTCHHLFLLRKNTKNEYQTAQSTILSWISCLEWINFYKLYFVPVVIFLKVRASAALPPRVMHILSNICSTTI